MLKYHSRLQKKYFLQVRWDRDAENGGKIFERGMGEISRRAKVREISHLLYKITFLESREVTELPTNGLEWKKDPSHDIYLATQLPRCHRQLLIPYFSKRTISPSPPS